MEPRSTLTREQINARSMELLGEFKDHYYEYRTEHPDDEVDRSTIFEGWVLQKVASLQLLVTELAERLEAVDEARERDP